MDSWTGYKQMVQMPEIEAKKLKIITLPPGSTSKLQPAGVYFNRTFKNFMRKFCNKGRWRHNEFVSAKREHVLDILDMLWYQLEEPRFNNFLKYSWFRPGYTDEHPLKFETSVQFCFDFLLFTICSLWTALLLHRCATTS